MIPSLPVLIVLPAASHPATATQLPTPAWSFHHENVLGTSLELTLRAPTLDTASNAESAALASIDRDNLILSAWRADSELFRWLATRDQPTPISPELLHVLALFDHWRNRTSGALNPAAEAAARLWRSAAAESRQPTLAELDLTIAAINQPHWQIDSDASSAIHLTPTPLTLASFTKSYIADRAASAALASGASAVTLNLGGDIVVRGDIAQPVAIADPFADTENDAPIDRIVLRDRAIATSGSYRRASAPGMSHILDPRTARPTGHILSSTVIAPDPTTAGALATAFSVLTPAESHSLAQSTPGVDYLLIARSGERIASPGWAAYRAASYTPAQASKAAAAQPFELAINLEITGSNEGRYRRPFVAVWIEDENHYPVRTLALWYNRERWLPDLRSWYRDDQLRFKVEGTYFADTVASATRSPGKYTLKWDGKDNHGSPLRPARYTICIEAAREHGGYDFFHHDLDLNNQPQQYTFAPGTELGAVTLDYRKQ